ncbi:MAG: valine--pyruvate transaminase [Kiritimatiellia bacterium]
MRLSEFGKRFGAPSGITVLMDDLGRAMTGRADMLMLGGGNPAHIPAVQAIWRKRMQEILAESDTFERMISNYDTPKGDELFAASLAAFFKQHFGWALGPENIAITNGSQMTFFCLINMFAGRSARGRVRKILFPLMPEYIGYADQAMTPSSYRAIRPTLEFLGDRTFKYHIDFDRLQVLSDTGAIVVSRPTNPTGNVLTDEEIRRLVALARENGIPLVVDNAYGNPFPGIIFTEATPVWEPPHTIHTFSLSKLGLPGVRTGIVIAAPEIIRALTSMNSILSLASGNIGPAIVRSLVASGELLRIAKELIRPYYIHKSAQAIAWLRENLPQDVEYYIHRSEGSLFLWLWLKDLPINDLELYQRLKKRGVLVVPGSFFFFGLRRKWRHQGECLRVTYSQADDMVYRGIQIIGEEVRRAYQRRT